MTRFEPSLLISDLTVYRWLLRVRARVGSGSGSGWQIWQDSMKQHSLFFNVAGVEEISPTQRHRIILFLRCLTCSIVSELMPCVRTYGVHSTFVGIFPSMEI